MLTETDRATADQRSRPDSLRIDPLVDPRWEALALANGDLFASTRWLRVLGAGYGLRLVAEVFGDPIAPRGGVVWAEIDDLRGRRLISLPFSDFTDPAGDVRPGEMVDLVERLTRDGAGFSIRLRGFVPPAGSGWKEQGRFAWHRKELGDTEDQLWSSLKSGARQNVRKAQRNNLHVSVDSDLAAVLDFRQLHVGLRKSKYRMLAQPTAFFRALAREFGPDDIRVVRAARDGRTVAGVVLLRHGDTAYYKFNASTAEGLDVRANDIVMWTALQSALAWGSSYFDFGVSDLDQPGLIRYKRKFASEEGEVVAFGHPTSDPPSRLGTGIGRILPVATRVLTDARCPDALTSRAGDVLYRHFC